MSFKAVELQIAVPRTVEQSRNQLIQQQQQMMQSEQISDELVVRTEIADRTVTESDENARAELHERQNRDEQHSPITSKKRMNKQQQVEEAPHPYKGIRLDIKM